MNFGIVDAAKMAAKLRGALYFKSDLTELELVSLERATDALCDFIRYRAATIQEKVEGIVK